MKKCLGILLLLAVGVLPIHSASAYSFNEYNMVFNGDAEWGYDFYYWGPAAQVGGAVTLNRVDEPNACFQLSVTSGVDDRAWLYQGILQDVVPGEPLQLKFRYKTLPGFVMGSTNGLVVKIHYYNASGGGVTEQGFSLTTTDGAWVEVTQLITVPNAATIRRADVGMEMKYWDTGTTEGTARFDDVQLYSTAAYGGNEIQNGDAEHGDFSHYKEAVGYATAVLATDDATGTGTHCFEMNSVTDPMGAINAFSTDIYGGFQYADNAILKFSYKTMPGFVMGAGSNGLRVQPRSFDGGSFKGEENIDLTPTDGVWKTVVFAFRVSNDSSVESLDVRLTLNDFSKGMNGAIRFDDIQVFQRIRSFFWRNDVLSGDYFNSDNWTTDSDSNATSPNYGWTHKIWSDTARIQPVNGASVDIALTEPNMIGGIWRHAADDGKEYDMVITGTAGSSLNITRSLGLTYSNGTDGYVDFQSGTINVTGDGGNALAPSGDGAFRIAHRGTTTLNIGPNAKYHNTLSSTYVAGSANSANTYGYLNVAGDYDCGSRALYVARTDYSGSAEGESNVYGTMTIEPTARVDCGTLYVACNPNMHGILDVNTGTNLDVTNSTRLISGIVVADYGIGTLNVKSGAKVSGRYVTVTSKHDTANATLNINGILEIPSASPTMADANSTVVINVAADGNFSPRSIYGTVGPNGHLTMNVDGKFYINNLFYASSAGHSIINLNAGSIFSQYGTLTGGKFTGATGASGVVEVNSRGTISLPGFITVATGGGTGVMNILDGTINLGGAAGGTPAGGILASSGTGIGTINMSGGTVNLATDGGISGVATGGNGNGTLNLSGGTFNVCRFMVSADANGHGHLNISGDGKFLIRGDYYTTIAQVGNADMTMTGGKFSINRLVIANYGNSVGNATITGGDVDLYGRIVVAQQANSVGTLTIGGTADVNVSDIDYTNYSVGIMIGQIEGKGDPTYTPPFLSAGNGTMILDGSHATVKTSYLTLGGRVYAQDGIQWNNYDAGPSQLQFKLDGVHGVGSGIYATKEVQLSDGPAANTGIVPSFKGTPVVGIYTVIRSKDAIDVNESFSTKNLLMDTPNWSYKVVTAGAEKRLKLFYCDLGNNECYVDFKCFATFAAQWVDGNADGYDLAYLATNWLKKFSTF